MPSTIEASFDESTGSIILLIPFFFASTAIGNAPFTCLNLPSRESSPKNTVLLKLFSIIISVAERSPIAIGRSKALPSFFISAGAKLTVIFFVGNFNPLFFIAAVTLSLLSLTALSGNPTIVKPGICDSTFVSTSTR